MSKVILNENELKAIINESVKKVLYEAVQSGEIDEGRVGNFFRSLVGGTKDAVGGDIESAKNAVGKAWQGAKDAAGEVWQGAKDAAGEVWQGAKDVAGNVAKGVQKRATVFNNSFKANQAYQKIMDIRQDIDDVLNSGIITGEKSIAALKNAKRCLQTLAASRKGVNSKANKRIMNSSEE